MTLKKIVGDGLLILDKENISTSEENYFWKTRKILRNLREISGIAQIIQNLFNLFIYILS